MTIIDTLSLCSPDGSIHIAKAGCHGIGLSAVISKIIPSGTTAQRPTNPSEPSLRYNTTVHNFEFWNGTAWTIFGSGTEDDTIGSLLLEALGNNLVLDITGDNLVLA